MGAELGANSSQRKLWAWQFSKAQTYGIGARIAAMEGGHQDGVVPETKMTTEETPREASAIDSKAGEETRVEDVSLRVLSISVT